MPGPDQTDRIDPGSDTPIEARLTAIFEGCRDKLFSTAYFVLEHRDDAAEALQDAFLNAWRKRADLAEITNLQAWLFTVTLNAAKDRRRRRTRRRAIPLAADAPIDTHDTRAAIAAGNASAIAPHQGADMYPALHPAIDEPPGLALERRELVDRVREEIARLPDPEREVFLLRQHGGLTYPEVASTMGIPEGTVKTRMRAALRRLREAMGA